MQYNSWLLYLFSLPVSFPFAPFHCLQVPSRAAASDQACDGSNGLWSRHGAHLHVHGTGGHCVQSLWWATGKEKAT